MAPTMLVVHDVTRLQFQHLSIQSMANRGPVQRNGFQNPSFYAEPDSVNNSNQWRSPRIINESDVWHLQVNSNIGDANLS